MEFVIFKGHTIKKIDCECFLVQGDEQGILATETFAEKYFPDLISEAEIYTISGTKYYYFDDIAENLIPACLLRLKDKWPLLFPGIDQKLIEENLKKSVN